MVASPELLGGDMGSQFCPWPPEVSVEDGPRSLGCRNLRSRLALLLGDVAQHDSMDCNGMSIIVRCSMCVHIIHIRHVYTYVHMHVYTSIYIYVCTYVYKHIYTYVYI